MTWFRFFLPVTSIGPEQARKIMADSDGWTLLDVRQKAEYDGGHLEGSIHIPLFQVRKRAGELNKGTALLVYCRCGNRSRLASRFLAAKGFTGVYNIEGGILGWEQHKEGLP
ncbi:rhodanese-like domain-containing protein [Desulfoluna butyratoxydans]|uniref:Rhodanese-like domain n=1 Tax=Desulfoluna butyratoxydans TaxID=231438 RepID=A0A4U8YRP1_9BACT|nr:rhodanese-like domain-containing protein [Desulfoluna butyratoxydans]VFQ47035.1 rhodanese-like domain [Desulfoluna butyratoxydans]